jgi:hypothetical protein
MTLRFTGVALCLLASGALAHDGHGAIPAGSWLHGLEPAHLAPALGALSLALLAGFALRRRHAARERNR